MFVLNVFSAPCITMMTNTVFSNKDMNKRASSCLQNIKDSNTFQKKKNVANNNFVT